MGCDRGLAIEVGAITPEVIDIRARILRAGMDPATAHFAGDESSGAVHAVARFEGRAVGVGSLMPEPIEERPGLRLRGMAVEPEFRGQGIGAAILTRLLGVAEAGVLDGQFVEKEHQLVWCLARVRARSLYERHGFIVVGAEFVVEGIGPHVQMIRS